MLPQGKVEEAKIRIERTKMKIRQALLAIASVLAIASAVPTKAGPEAVSERGTIIVYRPWSIIGYGIKNWEFNLNCGPDLCVRNGTYYRLSVPPGDSVISHESIRLSMMTHKRST